MSKLKPITSYEDAVEGLVTHGFITGFEDYGCFVSFYNDVKGLAHRQAENPVNLSWTWVDDPFSEIVHLSHTGLNIEAPV